MEYEISTNPGEKKKPLGKIVSGGELSRGSCLRSKPFFADRDDIETLIFDEIDTGISGRTAQKVSEKWRSSGAIARCCITHLPQIAAMADTHFEIEKHVEGQETTTQIRPLEDEASIRELARLLGGAEITGAVLSNAREMKELAQVHKNTRVK